MKKIIIAINIIIAIYFFVLANLFFWGYFLVLLGVAFGGKGSLEILWSSVIEMILAPFLIYGSIIFFRKTKRKYLYGLVILGIIWIESFVYRLLFVTHGKLEKTDLSNILFFGIPFIVIVFAQYLDKKISEGTINNQIFCRILIVIISIVLIAGGIFTWKYFSAPKEETRMSKEEEMPPLSNTAECKSSIPIEEIVTGSFHSINEFTSAGEVTLSGYVVTEKEEYFEEEIKKVYLKITSQEEDTPQAKFYSYFVRIVVEEGNTVNLTENEDLLFSLGELRDNGNTFSSTANISSLAKTKILSALKTAETISLRIQVPVWVGMGAPSNFSFACAVEFSKD